MKRKGSKKKNVPNPTIRRKPLTGVQSAMIGHAILALFAEERFIEGMEEAS